MAIHDRMPFDLGVEVGSQAVSILALVENVVGDVEQQLNGLMISLTSRWQSFIFPLQSHQDAV